MKVGIQFEFDYDNTTRPSLEYEDKTRELGRRECMEEQSVCLTSTSHLKQRKLVAKNSHDTTRRINTSTRANEQLLPDGFCTAQHSR